MPYRVAVADMGDVLELEYLYRVLSPENLSDQRIIQLFGGGGSIEDVGITWIHRHVWEHSFKPFEGQRLLDEMQLLRGLYYTAAGEDIMSSLEMSCRMAYKTADAVFYDKFIPPEDICC